MSNVVLVYDELGCITRQVVLANPESLVCNVAEGETYLLVDSPISMESAYIFNGAVLEKTPFPAVTYAPTQQGGVLTLTGIPTSTHVIWPDKMVTLEDGGVISCDTPYAGDYLFEFYSARYLAHKEIVHVTP
jgi:hypothetical protein